LDSVIIHKRAEYNRKLRKTLDKITNRLSAMPEVIKVILIGSYTAGRRDLFTDLDLIVVMDSEQDFIQRTAELYQKLEIDVDLDLLVYTQLEFEHMQERGFISHALKSGKVIYEK
jgi:predicted nucleotidyltransferase